MESGPTQAVLPLVGLAAENVIHDRYNCLIQGVRVMFPARASGDSGSWRHHGGYPRCMRCPGLVPGSFTFFAKWVAPSLFSRFGPWRLGPPSPRFGPWRLGPPRTETGRWRAQPRY
ncbi:MAG: hypothetical protein R6U98_05670 [Pirellulaceae bacterium]